MINKKVLIITPFCAPESHAAVFRAHKLVKYLKKEGWEPMILTVDINYNYNEDINLLKELDDIPIYRTRYVEPSLRGFRMWLTGKDRTFKTLKVELEKSKINSYTESKIEQKNSTPIYRKLYTYCLNNWLNKPDRFSTWKRTAIKKAKELIKEHNINLIYTTCLPFTTNQIGIELRKTMNVKWVADFRDPITYAKRMHSDIPHVFKLQRKIQDLTFKYADEIVVLSSAYKSIFHDQYEGAYNHKITFIPTGLDDEYVPSDELVKESENTIVFVGEYLKEYKDYFFKIFSEAIKKLPDDKKPSIKIIGNKNINEKQALNYVIQLGLKERVIFQDHMKQKDLYKEISKAKYALLIPGINSLWWNNYAKMVDYIALNKKIIALVPEVSEARNELRKSNLGIFLNNDFDYNVDLLKSLFSKDKIEESVNEYSKRYLASSQITDFIEIFQSLND